MLKKSSVVSAIVLLLSLFLAACSSLGLPVLVDNAGVSGTTAGQTVALRVCMSQSPLNVVPTYAQTKGLFQKHGLDVDLTTIENGTSTVTALIAGDCDVAFVAGSAAANAVASGHELALIAGLVNRQLYSLIVSPEIANAQDLRGRTVATSRPGGASDLVMRAALRSLGLQPDTDVTLISIGGQSERLAAMETGEVVATVISVPESARATQLGFHVLLDPSDLDTPYQHTVVSTSRQELQDNRPALKAFLQAIIEAGALMKRDREGSIATFASVLQMDQETDSAFLDEAYDQLILKYLESVPYPSREGVQALLNEIESENEGARAVDLDTMIDSTLIEELENSGFIRNVQGQ